MRTDRTREPLIVSDECNEVTSLSPSQQTTQHITSEEQELRHIAHCKSSPSTFLTSMHRYYNGYVCTEQGAEITGGKWSVTSNQVLVSMSSSASKSSIRRFVITEKAPSRAFSWLKAATTAFTFKTLLRHYAKQALTPRSLNVSVLIVS